MGILATLNFTRSSSPATNWKIGHANNLWITNIATASIAAAVAPAAVAAAADGGEFEVGVWDPLQHFLEFFHRFAVIFVLFV